jgi:hypothetical protein
MTVLAPHHGWFRLARTRDGILCLESTADSTSWSFCGDVPMHLSRQLIDDKDPNQVASVLERAIHLMGYVNEQITT